MMSDYLHFLDFIQKNTLLTGTFPGFTTLAKENVLLQQLYSFLIKGYMKAAGRQVSNNFRFSLPFFLIFPFKNGPLNNDCLN